MSGYLKISLGAWDLFIRCTHVQSYHVNYGPIIGIMACKIKKKRNIEKKLSPPFMATVLLRSKVIPQSRICQIPYCHTPTI